MLQEQTTGEIVKITIVVETKEYLHREIVGRKEVCMYFVKQRSKLSKCYSIRR